VIIIIHPVFAVMIVSWYQYSVFSNSDTADDSAVTSDIDIINDLNEELDWWEYQEETWLAIGMWYNAQCRNTLLFCACVLL